LAFNHRYFSNIFPENIVQASFQTVETSHVVRNLSTGVEYTLSKHYVNQMNVLGKHVKLFLLFLAQFPHNFYHFFLMHQILTKFSGIIVFCILIGVVVSYVGEPAKPLSDLFIALDIVITTIVGIIMW
jgi:Na+/H+-dicarboxylate symporter